MVMMFGLGSELGPAVGCMVGWKEAACGVGGMLEITKDN